MADEGNIHGHGIRVNNTFLDSVWNECIGFITEQFGFTLMGIYRIFNLVGTYINEVIYRDPQ